MSNTYVKRLRPLPPNSKLLVLGAGFSGQRIATIARELGSKVLCSRRNEKSPWANIVFDSKAQLRPPKHLLKDVTHLLSCIPPESNGKDPVLESLEEQLKEMPLQWVGYLSTTGVYGNCHGKWVSECDLPNPKQERSKRRLACEKAWQSSGLPVQILRLPGIYGPGRSAITSVRNGKVKMIHKPGQVFSRIHIDDIAGAIFHLIHLAKKGKTPLVVNIADDCPTSNNEVISFAAELLGKSIPTLEPFEIASKSMSPMALSFWQENRKVSNQLLCKRLGYELIYPDYLSGLKACLQEDG